MATNLDHNDALGTLHCPTCGAEQPWSDQCRRCRCDLTELHQVQQQWLRMKQQCLRHLSRGEFREALRWARVCHQMIPRDVSRRLVAVCHLQLGHWSAAVAIARRAIAECARK